MSQRSDITEQLVNAIGQRATLALAASLGGKQIKLLNGRGKPGALAAHIEEIIGASGLQALVAHFGGEDFTVPKCHAQVLAARNRQIVADYDSGTFTMLELIHKWKLTQRQLRTILNSPVAETTLGGPPVDDKQLGLF